MAEPEVESEELLKDESNFRRENSEPVMSVSANEWVEMKQTQRKLLAVLSETLGCGRLRKRKLSDSDEESDGGDAPNCKTKRQKSNEDDFEHYIDGLIQTKQKSRELERSSTPPASHGSNQILTELEQEYESDDETGPTNQRCRYSCE